MRHLLLIAFLAGAVQSIAADKPAGNKVPWLIQATRNPVSYTDDHVLKIELKITNNTDAKQNLHVPRFWECYCDSQRLDFAGWDQELRPYLPIPPGNPPAASEEKPPGGAPVTPPAPTGHGPPICQAQSYTDVELAPGESYSRSWNWRDISKDNPPKDFTFRMGLVINGSIGDERVWSSPITFKYPKPSDKAAGTK
jgi:hypothetical protein